MAKRPETLETLRLAIELLRRIPSKRSISASELHKQLIEAGFERDLRTIQRLLEILSNDLDIERDKRTKPYGYRWKDQAKALTMPNLTTQESLLLLLAREHLRNLLPAKLMKSMEGFFEQARRNLGPASNDTLERQWPTKVRVVATSQPLLPPSIKADIFESVSQALYENRWLHLEYLNAKRETSRPEVMPLGLAQQGERLYLVVRYKGYKNERSLALHRIQSAEVMSLFNPPSFNLKKFDDDGRFGFGAGERIRLSFVINKRAGEHLVESWLSNDQVVTEIDDNHYHISATVVDTSMLDWWLRGFGNAVSQVEKRRINSEG
jgi:predicted DNA-binding transcriptional regulator YafY